MNANFIDLVKEVFKNPEQMNPEEIRALIGESSRFFASLEKIMDTDDFAKREEAMNLALELKRFLESQIAIFSPYQEVSSNH